MLLFLKIKKQIEKGDAAYLPFCFFVIILDIPILVTGYYPANDYVNIVSQYLRYISLFLAFVIMMRALYPIKYHLKLWYLALFITLPFTGMYLFISSGYDLMWGLLCILSIILLFIFSKFFTAVLLMLLGFFCSITIHMSFIKLIGYEVKLDNHINNLFYSTYSIGVLFLTITYIIYHKLKEDKIQQRILEILGRSIAHDVTSPLSVGLESAKLIEDALENNNLECVKKHAKNLKECNTQAIQDIDIMLSTMRIEDDARPKDWGQYSILKSVNYALDKYFMNEEQRKQVSFLDKDNKKKDFTFTGSNTLLRHVIFNLLKNALKYAGLKAKIEIFIKNNTLHVRDDGCGIKEEVLTNLFQKYATTGGHGIGLNFCKEAMRKMGGNITCISAKGKGTEFIISFTTP